jgi:hypothetical protein
MKQEAETQPIQRRIESSVRKPISRNEPREPTPFFTWRPGIISLKCCRLCNTNTKGFREIMTFSTGSYIWGNDCPVILVKGFSSL